MSLPKNIKGGFIIDNIQFNNRSNNLINKRCFLNIAMLLRDSEVAKDLRYLMLNVIENKLDNQVTNTVQIVDNTNTELMKGILNSNTMIANTLMQLTNVINDKNENKVLVATDEIELQILNLADEFMTIQDYCRFLNGKNILPKKIGIQVVNQLFRNNNIYKENNAPTKENLMKGYFEFTTKEDSTNLIVCLTKQGMIMLYRIAKEQFTEDFIVDRNYKTKN